MSDLVLPAAPPPSDPIQRLVSGFIARQRSDATRRGYFSAIADFQKRTGAPNMTAAVADLISSRGRGHELVDHYLAVMQGAKLSASTMNQRLAALRALVGTAKTREMCDWTLETKSFRKEGIRDTRGPGIEGFRACLAAITGTTPMDLRNRAILRLLFDLALRREEVSRLDLADLDVSGNRIAVLGKGRAGKQWLSFGDGPTESPTLAALRAWVTARGPGSGAMFYNFDPTGKGPRRLTGNGIYRIIASIGEAAGYPKIEHKIRPHSFRHASITAILDLTSGDVRAAAQHSRHKNLNELVTYDDNRRNLQGQMARKLSGSTEGSST